MENKCLWQFGVELGKANAGALTPAISEGKEVAGIDKSSENLVQRFRKKVKDNIEGNAIMQKNYPRIYSWLASGDSAFVATLKLAAVELFPSIFTPQAFKDQHQEKDKLIASKLSKFSAWALSGSFMAVSASRHY